MTYSDQHIAGYRRASKDAAVWLQRRAGQMNDAKARDILHAAADHLGAELKANAAKMREGKERPDTAINREDEG